MAKSIVDRFEEFAQRVEAVRGNADQFGMVWVNRDTGRTSLGETYVSEQVPVEKVIRQMREELNIA